MNLCRHLHNAVLRTWPTFFLILPLLLQGIPFLFREGNLCLTDSVQHLGCIGKFSGIVIILLDFPGMFIANAELPELRFGLLQRIADDKVMPLVGKHGEIPVAVHAPVRHNRDLSDSIALLQVDHDIGKGILVHCVSAEQLK